MDEFLMVVPEVWIEIPNAEQYLSYEEMNIHISGGALHEFNIIFDQAGIIPPGVHVVRARAFKDVTAQLWVVYEPD